MADTKLTIIIVAYNSSQIIGQCLNGLQSPDFNIIVVDNASSDNTVEYVSTNYPAVNIIRSEKNIGFGRANNIGLRATKTEYALILNPDIITDIQTVDALLASAKDHPESAICAPLSREGKEDISGMPEIQDVKWVSGAAMLFNMKLLERVGMFDEHIFLFYEETDLCKRVVKSGMKITKFNKLVMNHLVGKSSIPSEKVTYLKYWHMAWSRFYFNRKHLPILSYYRKATGYLLKFLLKYMIYSLSGNKEKFIKYKASLAGFISFLAGKKAFDEKGDPQAKPR